MLRRTRRSPTACSWCRHRKVRCDALKLGSPCTRCRQDGRSKCVLRPHNPKQSENTITGLHSDDLRQSNGDPNLTSQLRAHGLSFDGRSASPPESPNVPYNEYAFIESQQILSLTSEDTAFLTSSDSLSLPASDAIDEFIHQYFKRIHPLVPVLDEAGFWRMYLENQSTGPKISLFVLQSMLFASCPFMSLKTLRQCGFSDRRDARKKLYNRAKLLFDLRTECRSHPNAQGAVLLTHYTSTDDPQSGSLWVTRAIEHATLIDAEPSLLAENVTMSLKKRLWWSILLRDRSLCIGLRRRPQVTSISLHGWSDWLSTEDFGEELHQSQVYDYDTKKDLLEALQKQCELAVLLTDLASLAFTHQKTPRRLLSMIEFQGILLSIKNIKRSLDEWKLPIQPVSSPSKASKSEGNDAVSKLTYMTYMYYQFVSTSHPIVFKTNQAAVYLSAARVDLAQYAAFILEENLFYAGDEYNNMVLEVSNDLRDGIEGLSLVMEHFSINGYADSLPLSVLGYLSMPLVLAAVDLKLSPSRKEAEARQRRLHSLSRIIRHSEILYDITDRVAVAINHMLQLAYSITQNLFLDRKPSRLFSSENMVRESTVSNNRVPARATSKSTLPRSNCPESWQDAFIRCPRAYLLISTSVDYTLSIGDLPSANGLPEIVRDLPAMGVITRLPWTSDIPFSKSTQSLVSHINQVQQQSYPVSLRSSCVEWIDASERISQGTEPEKKTTSQRVQTNYNLLPDAFSEYSATASLAMEEQLQYIDKVAEKTGCETTTPNLDFMDFGDYQGVVSQSVMETCAFRTPFRLTGHDLQADIPLEQHVFDTYGTPLPQSIKAIDSTIFDSFLHANLNITGPFNSTDFG